MKLAPGHILVSYEGIKPADGQWGTFTSATWTASDVGFQHAEFFIGQMEQRADRRNAKIIYRPGYPTEPLVVQNYSHLEKLIDAEWVDAASVPPQSRPGQWAIVAGDPRNGFEVTGGFESREAALAYGDEHMACESWWPLPLVRP